MTVVRLMNIGRGAVLSLCDRTGNLVRPWADAGFECLCVDIAHPAGEERRDGITWIGADVRTWLPPPRRYAIVFAAPPCSNLAVSGTRWFKEKGVGGLTEALEMGDQKIGEILSASVRQPDKPWPPEPVCEVIEIARSRALERGLETGVYNRRGVTVRMPFDGGDQERGLAEQLPP